MAARIAVLGLCVAALVGFAATAASAKGVTTSGAAGAGADPPAGAGASRAGKVVFEACRRGCRYSTIQRAVDAAGAYGFGHRRAKLVVAVRPGKYAEGVVVDGERRRSSFDRLTIEGTKRDPKRSILEGGGTAGRRTPQRDGIEATGVHGLVLRNLWARNFRADGFAVRASAQPGGSCAGFTMDNLVASGNRVFGFSATGCRGGRIVNSTAYRHGAAGFHVGATPCDRPGWSNLGPSPGPCQAAPRATVLQNDRGWENRLGFSGTNAKYVRVVESAFFDNGAGIALATLEGEASQPNGWNLVERNDVFWNNYDPFLARSAFVPAAIGLGEIDGQPVGYPLGVGIVLFGGDGNVVRRNKVFGNYKWGVASFSAPGEPFPGLSTELLLNAGNAARSVNNQLSENTMGREGADPNGEYDFFDDGTGGGSCWDDNNLIATFAPGNGTVPLGRLYPSCPQPPVDPDAVASVDAGAGLQLTPAEPANPRTLLGYLRTDPPQDQQCSWVRRVGEHPPFQNLDPVEVTAAPGELSCD